MPSIHKAVLLNEVVDFLTKGAVQKKSGAEEPWYVDGTLGGAGHALAMAKALKSEVNIVGLDLDQEAIRRGQEILAGKSRTLILERENFRKIDQVLHGHGIKNADMILYDLGISSDELQNSGRGFSFQRDEPLLMTLGDPSTYPFTAKDIVNTWQEEDLANVIFGYGEERYARRIAKSLVEYRQKKQIETSAELAEIVKGAMPRHSGGFRKTKIHPATKTFQALRIAVNDELKALQEGLEKGYERLTNGGRMAVISFHSLEDRIVKNFNKEKEKKDGAIISKKPIRPSAQEILENPRARSAKLRTLVKKRGSKH